MSSPLSAALPSLTSEREAKQEEERRGVERLGCISKGEVKSHDESQTPGSSVFFLKCPLSSPEATQLSHPHG